MVFGVPFPEVRVLRIWAEKTPAQMKMLGTSHRKPRKFLAAISPQVHGHHTQRDTFTTQRWRRGRFFTDQIQEKKQQWANIHFLVIAFFITLPIYRATFIPYVYIPDWLNRDSFLNLDPYPITLTLTLNPEPYPSHWVDTLTCSYLSGSLWRSGQRWPSLGSHRSCWSPWEIQRWTPIPSSSPLCLSYTHTHAHTPHTHTHIMVGSVHH